MISQSLLINCLGLQSAKSLGSAEGQTREVSGAVWRQYKPEVWLEMEVHLQSQLLRAEGGLSDPMASSTQLVLDQPVIHSKNLPKNR